MVDSDSGWWILMMDSDGGWLWWMLWWIVMVDSDGGCYGG